MGGAERVRGRLRVAGALAAALERLASGPAGQESGSGRSSVTVATGALWAASGVDHGVGLVVVLVVQALMSTGPPVLALAAAVHARRGCARPGSSQRGAVLPMLFEVEPASIASHVDGGRRQELGVLGRQPQHARAIRVGPRPGTACPGCCRTRWSAAFACPISSGCLLEIELTTPPSVLVWVGGAAGFRTS